MYYILSDHDIIGPSTRVSKGFPVVTPVNQITSNVPVYPSQTRDNGTIPLGIQTSNGEGKQPMLAIQNPKDPGPRGDKSIEGRPSKKWMATRWKNSADNLRGL